jgi:hypothetical protein
MHKPDVFKYKIEVKTQKTCKRRGGTDAEYVYPPRAHNGVHHRLEILRLISFKVMRIFSISTGAPSGRYPDLQGFRSSLRCAATAVSFVRTMSWRPFCMLDNRRSQARLQSAQRGFADAERLPILLAVINAALSKCSMIKAGYSFLSFRKAVHSVLNIRKRYPISSSHPIILSYARNFSMKRIIVAMNITIGFSPCKINLLHKY